MHMGLCILRRSCACRAAAAEYPLAGRAAVGKRPAPANLVTSWGQRGAPQALEHQGLAQHPSPGLVAPGTSSLVHSAGEVTCASSRGTATLNNEHWLRRTQACWCSNCRSVTGDMLGLLSIDTPAAVVYRPEKVA